ncbi:MAG: glycoside hydrolase family 15 protein [Candidatus Saccharibacteria bacterium]
MARPIVLSNGELHVGLNLFGLVHDFYFPYVGLENHSAGEHLRHRVGIMVDGALSWLDDGSWSFVFDYPHSALIGHTVAKNDQLGIMLEFDDTVDASLSAFLRNIHVINMSDRTRSIRLFMHQAFAIEDSRSNTDTGQYLPDSDAILHYRGRRAFIVSGFYDGQPFDQHSIGLFGIEGHEGTYRDAEDGELSNSNVEHGRVDSTIRFSLELTAHSSDRVHYWIAAGTSIREALYIHKQVREDGLLTRIEVTARWWHEWMAPARLIAEKIAPQHRKNFLHSMMIIKSQIDKRGAVIASTDTTMLNYSRDAYAYCWPRDGAFVLWPLIRMGYTDEAYRFFEFCKRGLHPNGHLMHKYRADGAMGSSWHPYVHDGIVAPPIQEDETALVLFVFAQYYQMHPDNNLIKNFYSTLVKPMANFLLEYIEPITGLPKPSYDLWEETFLTTTYTTSVVHAALLAASDLADIADDAVSAVKWRSSAGDISLAAHKHLYNDDRTSFYKGLIVKDGQLIKNDTIDCSSVFGAFMFGLFPSSSPEVASAVETVKQVFGVNQGALGLPRYENDNYRRADQNSAPNQWFIASLWLAQYYIEQGVTQSAMEILDWVEGHALSTGMMAEQINPQTGQTVSPVPLTWTHAEYVSTLLDTITEPK